MAQTTREELVLNCSNETERTVPEGMTAEERANYFMKWVATGGYDATKTAEGNASDENVVAQHKEMTMKEMANYYDQWAATGGYEEDVGPGRYNGPEYCARAVADIYKAGRESVTLLDVGAGTGMVADWLIEFGFKADNMDALDPSEGMLKEAKEKGVYKNYICDFMDGHRLDVADGSYDCLTVSGAMRKGHIPASSITEMIRCVKSGGHVVIVMREEYLTCVDEYKDLEKMMAKIEDDKIWRRIDRSVVPNYSFGKNGVIFVYRIV